jgi:hypothetical protein
MNARGQSRLRRILDRLTSSQDELEAEELLEETQDLGGTPISSCPDREQVTVMGTLRTVTLRPRAGVPALEAELYDGSGTLALVWLGRRRIAGIEPGRRLLAQGRVTYHEGGPVMYNPRYELRAAGVP